MDSTVAATSTPPALPADLISRALQGVQYPLRISFKVIAFSNQITVTDATGRSVLFVRQKLLKLKEHIEIFTDKTKSVRVAEIRANKVIDWSARYFFTEPDGAAIGSVGRRGWRSIWKAHYESFNPGDDVPDFSIHEENGWIKVADAVIGDIPIIGMLSAFLFHPSYSAARGNGAPVMRLTKQAAFFEGKFQVEKVGPMTPREELNLILSFLMLVLLERRRG